MSDITSEVVIDMSISLDGFVAGPDGGKEHPLGTTEVFDWYFSGENEYHRPLFRPEPSANLDEGERMFVESGAFIFGRRTYEIANGWGGRHPVNGVPIFVLTHKPPAEYPRGPSNLTFITDGIESDSPGARRHGRQGHQARRHIPRKAGARLRSLRRDHRSPRALSARRRRSTVRRASARLAAREAFRQRALRDPYPRPRAQVTNPIARERISPRVTTRTT